MSGSFGLRVLSICADSIGSLTKDIAGAKLKRREGLGSIFLFTQLSVPVRDHLIGH